MRWSWIYWLAVASSERHSLGWGHRLCKSHCHTLAFAQCIHLCKGSAFDTEVGSTILMTQGHRVPIRNLRLEGNNVTKILIFVNTKEQVLTEFYGIRDSDFTFTSNWCFFSMQGRVWVGKGGLWGWPEQMGSYSPQKGCWEGGKSEAWRPHIPGLPLTAWVNLGTKPNLWGHWTSVDTRLASQEGWGSSMRCVCKLLSAVHIITF